MKNKNNIYIVSGIAGIILLAVAAFAINRYFTDYKENVSENFHLYITPEMSYCNLQDTLEGKLRNIRSFERCFKRENPQETLSAGHYYIKKGMHNKAVARIISNGWQTPVRLTLSGNIRGIEKLCSIAGKRLMCDSITFSNYLNAPGTAEEYGFTKETFSSMFIPDTYELYWSCTPQKFAEKMHKEYIKFWNTQRTEKAKQIGLSPIDVSVLASIVCEESNYAPELSTIAGVYMNRLKRGMNLEADPTVKYALGDPGIKRILYKHLKVDSPYNTYIHNGLPPGPITIPSKSGIDAVLNYAQHNYLYFCANAKLNGTHEFARTLSEHNRNARAYQSAINRLKIK